MRMNEYHWTSKDGIETKISFSANFDNLINRHRGKEPLGSAFLMDGGIVFNMPKVMRYCFEERVELRKNKFIRDLPSTPRFDSEEHYADEARFYFKIHLHKYEGTIMNSRGELVISSYPLKLTDKSSVSFNPRDVPKLVEGFLRIYGQDDNGGNLGYARIAQAVNLYHEDLDKRLIR